MWLLLLILTLSFIFYKYLTSSYGYWKKRRVPHLPVSIFFGNMSESLLGRKSLAQIYSYVYDAFPNLQYVGFYKIRQPAIVVRDPGLIKNVLIKEFRSFHDNDFYVDEKVDPIFGKNPFCLKGERWKVARSQLTPCFSNKKLKEMFPFVDEVGSRMIKYINDFQGNNKYDGFEAKELATKFTTDLVANCMFGMDGKSFESPKAELRHTIRQIFQTSTSTAFKHVCVIIIPALAKFFDLKFFPDNVTSYLRKIVDESIKYRKENNVKRGDFLDAMLEIKAKLGENQFTNDDITAHAGGVFADGTETSSIALSYLLFELAVNPDVQSELRERLDEILCRNGNKFNYEEVLEMEYLDNALKESLRLYPPFPYLAKTCTKTTQWPSPYGLRNGSTVTIDEGLSIFVPIYSIHRDPKYYSNPNAFEPERFSKENKSNSTDCTFLPFGDGPRYCLGEKYGILQVKTAIAYIIANFEVNVNSKTILPLQIDPKYFLLKPVGDIYLNLVKRH